MVGNILKQVIQTVVLITIILDNVINFKTLGVSNDRKQKIHAKLPRKIIKLYQNNSGWHIKRADDLFDGEEDIKSMLEEKFRFRNDEASTRYKIAHVTRKYPVHPENVRDRHIAMVFRSYAVRRIVGGMDTSIAMYPYNAAISKHDRQWCGGSIIDVQWVLTAGHCMEVAFDGDVKKLRPFVVRAGSSYHNRGGYQARINKVFFPRDYTPGSVDYDYSLVRLDRPMPIGRKIAVLNLPSKDFVHEEGDMMIVTGWGSTNESGDGYIPDRLHFVPVPVINSTECQKSYNFYITSRMLCAGYSTGGKDACNHDSGGPAVYDGVLLGIVSFGGKMCGDPRSPGVYSRVAKITEFVEHTIKNNEAITVPELLPKIQKAKQRELMVEKYKARVYSVRAKMKKWFHGIFQSPKFIQLAKNKLQNAGLLTRRNFGQLSAASDLDDKSFDEINLTNMVNDRILEDGNVSIADKLLRILALHEVMLDEDSGEKTVLMVNNERDDLKVFIKIKQ